MGDSTVLYDSTRGIARIVLNRPEKLNAVNRDMADALSAAWEEFESGQDVVAIVSGRGDHFTAGVDVTDPPTHSGWVPNLGIEVGKPVIAAVDGWCIGGGMMFLQQADLAVAAEGAQFQYPEARLGLSKGLAAGLVSRVPHKLAMEIMLLGRVIGANEMHRFGLLNDVVEQAQLHDRATEYAQVILENDNECTRFIKRQVQQTMPRGPGEKSAQMQWEYERLPGNRRLLDGSVELNRK